MPAPVFVADHPLVLDMLARLRHRDTRPPQFRELVHEITQYLFYEATRDVRVRRAVVPTPLADAVCHEVAEKIGLVPILRAGLGMAAAMVDALPEAAVWHLGLY